MTFSQLRNQVDTLCRKYASELEVYRARPLALELCDEMASAVTGTKSGPKLPLTEWARILYVRMSERGISLKTYLGLHDYLECCLDRRVLPQVNDVLRSLFPKARERGLIPPSRIEIPFRPRRQWNHSAGYFMVALSDEMKAKQARGTLQQPNPGPPPLSAAFRLLPEAMAAKPRLANSPSPSGGGQGRG